MHAFRFGSRLALAALFLGSSLASAQAPSPAPAAAPPAPVPPAILTAKKLFLANDGADAGLFPHPFSGSTSRGYDEFYAALRAMGRYELVSSPSQADLVLEFRLLRAARPNQRRQVEWRSRSSARRPGKNLRRSEPFSCSGPSPRKGKAH